MSTYARLPVTFVKGEGAWLWDTEGKRYLDSVSGIAVCGLGHAHPEITQAITEQAALLMHTSNLYGIAHQQSLADELTRISGMHAAFFCNSGAEANEAAIKLSRLHARARQIENPQVIVMEGAFHGRTMATLTATGNLKVRAGFEPLVSGFLRVPYNDVAAIRALAAERNDIVAVMVEPVQGEGGVIIPAAEYLVELRACCDQHNWLLILDEIQTGMGRTGKWFAHQHAGILPDVMTLAKTLGNGFPIGACLVNPQANLFKAGNHGTTFGGNPLACRVALEVIRVIEHTKMLARINELSLYFKEKFQQALAQYAGVKQIRVHGLMIGIELDRPCGRLVTDALERGLLINVTAEKSIRLLPPFIIDNAQADEIVATTAAIIGHFLALPMAA